MPTKKKQTNVYLSDEELRFLRMYDTDQPGAAIHHVIKILMVLEGLLEQEEMADSMPIRAALKMAKRLAL